MKTKFNGILTLLIAFMVQFTFAQERTISGTVSDDVAPLADVTVKVKGTDRGTVTDFDGKYSLKASTGETIVFTYVSYGTVEKIVGNSNVVDVTMKEEGEALDEVVVTAQGIKRSKKALGYAVTTIKTEALEDKAQGDIGRLLQGKAAGVRITSTGGVSGSGTNIIIRGYSSISGGNQPLFVIDGVPFASDTNQTSSFVTSSNTASRFGDIDPNNIGSLNVLSGLSATALYGEEGKNGVILITTKSAKVNGAKKTEVSFSQSFFVNNIVLPDYQNTYGNGFFNDYGPFFSNWGSAFSSQSTIPNAFRSSIVNNFGVLPSVLFPGRTDLDAENIEYKPHNSQEEFFRTGTISNTSLNFSSATEKGSFTINYGHLDDKSFVPGNSVRRNNFSIGGRTTLANKFSISGKFNYSKFDKKSPMTDASFGSDVFGAGIASIWNVLYLPRSVDLFGSPYQHPQTGESIWYRADNGRTNPLWVVDNTHDDDKTNHFFSNATVNYKFNDSYSLAYRIGIDYYSQDQRRAIQRGANDGNALFGSLNTTNTQNTIYDHTLLLNVDKDINETFGFTFTGGVNLRRNETRGLNTNSTRQLPNAFGLLNHSVFEDTDGFNFDVFRNNNAVYGNAIFDYSNWMFLSLSARNDWSSVFEKNNRSVFSYGVSLSLDLTTAIKGLKSSTPFNYLKVRAAYGQAPGFASPYSTRPTLGVNAEAFNLGGNNISTNSVSNFLTNPNLEPELSTEFEFGIEAKLFKNRVGFDLTYYSKNTNNQILNRPLPAETGFTTFADNFGNVSNEGIELGFNLVPYTNDNFSWDLSGSYNINENLVTDTDGQIVQISGFGGGLGNYAIEGQAFGIIQGSAVLRDQNGTLLVDSQGDYVIDPATQIIGDPNADWTLSIINGFKYKNLSLTAQVEYQHGGDMFLRTANTLAARGLTTDTDFDREQTFILPGNNINTGQPNDVQIGATDAYFTNYGFGAQEFNMYDVTNLRLREVALSYKLPKKYLEKTPFGNVSFTLQGYNLFVKAFNTPDGVNFDPDINSVGVGNGQGFDFLTSWNSRRYGGSVKLTF